MGGIFSSNNDDENTSGIFANWEKDPCDGKKGNELEECLKDDKTCEDACKGLEGEELEACKAKKNTEEAPESSEKQNASNAPKTSEVPTSEFENQNASKTSEVPTSESSEKQNASNAPKTSEVPILAVSKNPESSEAPISKIGGRRHRTPRKRRTSRTVHRNFGSTRKSKTSQ